MSYTALVEFSPLRTDLANLPDELTKTLYLSNTAPQNIVIQVFWNQGLRSQQTAYLGWSGMTAEKSGKFEVDPTFAQNIGLSHNTKVDIKVHINPPVATTIHLEPKTQADWEIVETHVAYLESWMINQVRAVSLSHSITVYPSSTSIACLNVTKIVPTPSLPFAKLSPDSEVIIAPKVVQKTESTTVKKKKEVPQFVVLRSSAFPYGGIEAASTRKPVLYADLPTDASYVQVSVVHPAGARNFSPEKPPQNGAATPDEISPAKTVLAALVKSPVGEPIMSFGLSSALATSAVGAILKIQPLGSAESQTGVVVHPYTTKTNPQSLNLGNNKKPLPVYPELEIDLVSPGMLLPPSENLPVGGIVECQGSGPAKGSIVMGAELALAESAILPSVTDLVPQPGRKVVGRDEILKKVLQSCMSGSGTLIYGSRASGKTVVINHVVEELQKQLIYKASFNAGHFLDKPVSTVREALRNLLLQAAWHAPSVVVLEDLDQLIPAELEHADSSRSEQLAEIFQALVRSITASRKVSLLASAQSKEALSASLLSAHVFDELTHIRSPDKRVREAILTEALAHLDLKSEPGFDVLDVVADTEGYQPGDMWTLAERITALTTLEKVEGRSPLVTNALFKQATDEFTPASLRGVKLQKSTVSWKDIGGMQEVKRVILETLEWPTKYAPIFANCPLRLRSGLLLYGYPGCGKTLMASAVAAQCGLNFISVKGPEILNKYIGASEQSVRDLFDRAQAAKPCVLFFDEFDSIAPKRGHDSTGVTDRVVNQMLTQMDGAEGLDGVYVLAATSRPDLIDGALLRPGRLDKSLLCDMPSLEDRLEILRTVEAKMDLADDVDLKVVAERTAGFSGADMQAVMTNAYLHAIHSTIDKDGEPSSTSDLSKEIEVYTLGDGIDPANVRTYAAGSIEQTETAESAPQASNQPKVTWDDIEHSLSSSKPSSSEKELRKLKAIYDKFVDDRDGKMPPGTSSNDIGGRVTLQ